MSETTVSEAEGDYYYSGGRQVPLQRETGVFSVKYSREGSLGLKEESPDIDRLLTEECDSSEFLARYGLQVFTAAPEAEGKFASAESADQQLARLNTSRTIEYATPVFRQTPTSAAPMYVTNRILVKFLEGVTDEQQAELHSHHGAEVEEVLGYAENAFLLVVTGTSAGRVVQIANAYFESGLTEWAHPDFIPVMQRKSSFSAEERDVDAAGTRGIAEDWHVRLAGVDRAWSTTRGSSDVSVAIIDDGVEVNHREFAGRVDSFQFDFASGTADGSPKRSGDRHGTPCASVAVAAGQRALGAAPACSLMAIRMGRFASADEARMFQRVADEGADVISCSWGPTDGDGPFPLPDATRAAIDYCVDPGRGGRGGKGIPVFFAAGNGNELISDDGYASYSKVMAIAASTSEDTRAPYSDFGPEIWICAPSNGGTRGVFTADRAGAAGYNPDRGGPADDQDYFERFGGTSSATPLVAGVAGLMISANPNITERQVRDILRDTAVRIGDQTTYGSNGHSPQHGYGRVDAERAVLAAANLRPSAGGGQPSIQGPTTHGRTAGAPSFDVGKGGRRFFAVEVATRAELFDNAAHGSERNSSNFFASWQEALSEFSPYQLPDSAWQQLSNADRLFYRAHVADDNAWSNHATTTSGASSASAPFVTIQAGGQAQPQPQPGTVSINGPASVSRAGSAPTFQVSTGGRNFYAVEVATRAELFNASSHQSERSDDNFYASWRERLSSTSPFQLPASVWARLRQADRLFYRAHFADDNDWANYAVTVEDADANSAPVISVTTDSQPFEVTYPSGLRLSVATDASNEEAADDVGGGAVPLVDVAGQLHKKVSANFRLNEFVRGGTRVARLSVELVRGLQAMRSELDAGIRVDRGYVPRSGASGSEDQHQAGWAARISSSRAQPIRLAELALDHFGSRASLTLGQRELLIDLRPNRVVTVEPGASMDAAAFEAFVEQHMRTRLVSVDARATISIAGPIQASVADPAPQFLINASGVSFVALEVAADPAAFSDRELQTDDRFYGSWTDRLVEIQPDGVVLSVPDQSWAELSRHPFLYYRAVGCDDADWSGLVATVNAETAARAPRVRVRGMALLNEAEVNLEFLSERERLNRAESAWLT